MYRLYFEYAYGDRTIEPLKLTYDFETEEEAKKFMTEMFKSWDTWKKGMGVDTAPFILDRTAHIIEYEPRTAHHLGMAMWGILEH